VPATYPLLKRSTGCLKTSSLPFDRFSAGLFSGMVRTSASSALNRPKLHLLLLTAAAFLRRRFDNPSKNT